MSDLGQELEPIEDLEERVRAQDKLPQEVVGLNEFWEELEPFLLKLEKGGDSVEGAGLDRQAIETLFKIRDLQNLANFPPIGSSTHIDKGWMRTNLDPLGAHARVYIRPEKETGEGDLTLSYIKGYPPIVEVSSTFPTNPCRKIQFKLHPDNNYDFKATIDSLDETRVITGTSRQDAPNAPAVWSVSGAVGKNSK